MGNNTIFLSYASIDNKVPGVHHDRPGWVKVFHDYVTLELRRCESFDFGSKLYHIWWVNCGFGQLHIVARVP
jgi:hypothetical protein